MRGVDAIMSEKVDDIGTLNLIFPFLFQFDGPLAMLHSYFLAETLRYLDLALVKFNWNDWR